MALRLFQLFQFLVTLFFRLPRLNKHCIPKRKEPIFILHCRLISLQDEFPAGKSADEHDKGRLGQVKISDKTDLTSILIEKIKNGDNKAWEELISQYEDYIHSRAWEKIKRNMCLTV